MKILKSIYVLCLLAACSLTGLAQSGLVLEASQLFSSFKFKDRAGVSHNKEYQGLYTGGYGIGYRYVNDIGLIIKPGIGVRHGGANLVYDDQNYSWRLQYAEIKLGLGYMTRFEKINPYFMASGYYAFLLRGAQTTHNENLNITESDLLSNIDYGLIFSPGVNIKLSDYISSYLELNYFKGLTNIEKDPGQKTKNFAYGLSLGVAISLTEN
ncbi:MAG TPA: outer membrane beta-barrel protein [Saprospiraceae bacterium]|nr:outer membrane beta-barrel protein [Saprospiraceae bacterium]HNT21593.1 outer membrane beta-barrel protein [Saprospiraceae bacterium]